MAKDRKVGKRATPRHGRIHLGSRHERQWLTYPACPVRSPSIANRGHFIGLWKHTVVNVVVGQSDVSMPRPRIRTFRFRCVPLKRPPGATFARVDRPDGLPQGCRQPKSGRSAAASKLLGLSRDECGTTVHHEECSFARGVQFPPSSSRVTRHDALLVQ